MTHVNDAGANHSRRIKVAPVISAVVVFQEEDVGVHQLIRAVGIAGLERKWHCLPNIFKMLCQGPDSIKKISA